MANYTITQVSEIALEDISRYIKSTKSKYKKGFFYNWVVMASHLDTKEVRALNKELGINSLNHLENINWMKMKRYKK